MFSGVCEVASWLDWLLSTCGGFREHLPVEVCADFERLILSGSRASRLSAISSYHDEMPSWLMSALRSRLRKWHACRRLSEWIFGNTLDYEKNYLRLKDFTLDFN